MWRLFVAALKSGAAVKRVNTIYECRYKKRKYISCQTLKSQKNSARWQIPLK
jgi:hypothetical protein